MVGNFGKWFKYQQQQRAAVETIPGIFRLLSTRRWPSHRALDFLARVQFQLSAEQRENVIRRLDLPGDVCRRSR